jgi:hypothetical protein
MFTFSALLRLCAKRPAATSSTRESAACRTTSERCRNDAPWAVDRAFERKASAGCVRAAMSAGASPKSMPVTSESAKAKPMTSGAGEALIGMLC